MKSPRKLFVVCVLLMLTAAGLALAQEAGAPAAGPAAAAAPAGKSSETSLWSLWVTGGWAMYPIGLCNIATIAFAIYGYIMCADKRMAQSFIVPAVKSATERFRFEEALTLCRQNPGVFSNIFAAGLTRLVQGRVDVANVEKAMEEMAVEENISGLRSINYLSIAASTAPMFGLLGTVSGMIKAFDKIGKGGMGDPELLAANIGEAMITTAYGLMVGIPAMVFYFYHKSVFQARMARIARVAGDVTHQIGETSKKIEDGEITLEQVRAVEPAAKA